MIEKGRGERGQMSPCLILLFYLPDAERSGTNLCIHSGKLCTVPRKIHEISRKTIDFFGYNYYSIKEEFVTVPPSFLGTRQKAP